jgi:hypothetical protein
MKYDLANKTGAGNGAGALSFQVECLGRAVPDLCRWPSNRKTGGQSPP